MKKNRKLKVFPSIYYYYPNKRFLWPEEGFTFVFTPSFYIKNEGHWGVSIGLSWLLWAINIRFAIIDMDAVKECEEMLKRDREEYNKRKEGEI